MRHMMPRSCSILCGFYLSITCLYIFCIYIFPGALPVKEGLTNISKRPSKEGWKVVVSVSEGFDSMFQNWWLWFKKLNLDMEVFLVAEDYETMKKYNSSPLLHVHQGLINRNMSTDKGLNYNSYNYNKLVSRRAGYILNFLLKNYSIIYTDIDTVWLKDPTPYFKGDYDMWGQTGNSLSPSNTSICTGFLAIKPTAASKQFTQQWDDILTKSVAANKPLIDQNVFNQHLNTVKSAKNSMKIISLPSKQFKTGNDYNFRKPPPTQVVLVHNNYIIGLENKIKRFKTSGLWTEFNKTDPV